MSQWMKYLHCWMPASHKKNEKKASSVQSSDSDSTTTSETDDKHFTTSLTLDRLSIIDHSNITNESVAFHDAVLSSTLDFSDSSNLLNNIGISSNEDLVSPDFIPGSIRANDDSDGYIPLEKCTSGNPQFAKQRQMQTKFTKNDAELLSFVPPSPCNHMNVSLHDSLPPLLPKKGKGHRTLGNSHSISGCENRNGRVIPNVDRNYYNNSPVAGRKLENIDADRRNNNTPFNNFKSDHGTNDASSADMIEHLDSAYQMSRNDSEHLHNRQNKNSLHSHLDLDNPVALPNSRTKHHIGNSVHTETNGYYDFSEPQDLFGMTPPTPPIKGSAEMKNVELQFSPEIRSSRNNPLKMCGEDHYYNVMGSQNNNASSQLPFRIQSGSLLDQKIPTSVQADNLYSSSQNGVELALPIRSYRKKTTSSSSCDDDVLVTNNSHPMLKNNNSYHINYTKPHAALQGSASFSCRPAPPVPVQSPEVNYLQLDLDQLSEAGKNSVRPPLVNRDSDEGESNYKEIDWCKTKALLETTNDRHKEVTATSESKQISSSQT